MHPGSLFDHCHHFRVVGLERCEFLKLHISNLILRDQWSDVHYWQQKVCGTVLDIGQ